MKIITISENKVFSFSFGLLKIAIFYINLNSIKKLNKFSVSCSFKKIFFSNIKRGKLGGEMSGNVLTGVPRRNLKSAVFCLFEKVGEI